MNIVEFSCFVDFFTRNDSSLGSKLKSIEGKRRRLLSSPDSPASQAKLEPMLTEKAGNGVQLRALDGL
jgi:hypothetical protein